MRRELVRCLGSSTALVHRKTIFLRSSSCRTISSICGCISGSPPAIETIGAPHSSIAPTACSTGIRCLSSVCGLLDLAAAGALEVAGEQRLELDEQRELLAAQQLLLHQVRAEPEGLTQGHGHGQLTSWGSVNADVLVGDPCPRAPRPARGRRGADQLVDQVRRRRRAGGDADRARRRQPAQVDLAGVVDQVRGHPSALGHLDQPAASSTSSCEPTTSTRSLAGAIARTASWRLVVA